MNLLRGSENMEYNILIIEDDLGLARAILDILNKYNFNSKILEDFKNIESVVKEKEYDLIILDINLPYYDGFYWCRKIRKITLIPIIIISSRDTNMDQIMALEYGADDYIIKPFDSEILIAKIKSFLRRSYGELSVGMENKLLKIGFVNLDSHRQQILFKDKKIYLSFTENKILKKLFEEYPNSVSRSELIFEAWDENSFVEENTLNVNIRRIRNKIQENKLPIAVRTIRSFGYQLILKEENQ